MRLSVLTQAMAAHRWLVVMTILLVTAVALVVGTIGPKTYESEALVSISDRNAAAAALGVNDPTSDQQALRNLSTQMYLLQLPTIAEPVIKDLGLNVSATDLLKNVDVAVLGQSSLLSLTVRDDQPERSAAIANGLAHGYVEWSRKSESQALEAAEKAVEARRVQTLAKITFLESRIQSGNTSEGLRAQLDVAKATYAPLPGMLERLRTSQPIATGAGAVVSEASVPIRPVNPGPVESGGLGLVGGLMFGAALAVTRENALGTVRSPEEVEEAAGAPVLRGAVRAVLDHAATQDGVKSVAVTSTTRGQDVGPVAQDVASALARDGQRVVYVDCNLAASDRSTAPITVGETGLVDVLADPSLIMSAIRPGGVPGLWVMPFGTVSDDATEKVFSRKMRQVVTSLGEAADWVILAAPPVQAYPDSAQISQAADRVLLVVQSGLSRREEIVRTRGALHDVGARILGVIMVGAKHRRGAQ